MTISKELTLGRTCGSCTACCKTHYISEIAKMPGVWCEHCAIGKGCKIYSSKPDSCTKFKCSWLMGFGADEDRPDRSKIVLNVSDMSFLKDVPMLEHLQMLRMAEVSEGALKKSTFAQELRKLSLLRGMAVYEIPLMGQPRITFPDGKCPPKEILDLLKEEMDVFRWSSL